VSAGPGRSVRDDGHLTFEGGHTDLDARLGMQSEGAPHDSGKETEGLLGCHLLLAIKIGCHASTYEDERDSGLLSRRRYPGVA